MPRSEEIGPPGFWDPTEQTDTQLMMNDDDHLEQWTNDDSQLSQLPRIDLELSDEDIKMMMKGDDNDNDTGTRPPATPMMKGDDNDNDNNKNNNNGKVKKKPKVTNPWINKQFKPKKVPVNNFDGGIGIDKKFFGLSHMYWQAD